MRLVAAELRDSWRAWLGVSLTLLVTSFGVSLPCLVLAAATDYHARKIDDMESQAALIMAGVNLGACILVGLSVIGSATGLVVASRRGSLARLSLAGAAPRTVVGSLLSQLAAACLVFGLLGGLLALAAFGPTWHWLSRERNWAYPEEPASVTAMLTGVLVCVAVACLGGLRKAVQASRIPPVEALREAQAPTKERGAVGRWVGFVLVTGLVVLAYIGAVKALREGGQESRGLTLQVPMLMIPLSGICFVLGRDLFMGQLTRAWTALVPGRSATWHLARATALGKQERLNRSITPSMFTLGLLVGMVTIGNSTSASLMASGAGLQLEHGGITSMLQMMGLPLLLALAGSVSSLVMMSSQREGELALDGVVGATPAQQVMVPVLEGVIVSVTAALLGAAMCAVAIVAFVQLMPLIYPQVRVEVPWLSLVEVVLLTTAVVVASTALPVLHSLRQPPNRVLARLVAE